MQKELFHLDFNSIIQYILVLFVANSETVSKILGIKVANSVKQKSISSWLNFYRKILRSC